MDSTSACARVFAVPELVALIVRSAVERQEYRCGTPFVIQTRTPKRSQLGFLRNLALVARNWTEPALAELWVDQVLYFPKSVHRGRLEKIRPSRQRYYADKIRSFEMSCHPDQGSDYSGLNVKMPNLLSLELEFRGNSRLKPEGPEDYLARKLLQPSIRGMTVHQAFLPLVGLYETVAITCPSLTHLKLGVNERGDMSGILGVLHSVTTLQYLELGICHGPGLREAHPTWDLLLDPLARLPALRQLDIPRGFPASIAEECLSSCERPFPSLKKLEIACFHTTIQALVPLIPNVTELTMWVLMDRRNEEERPLLSPVVSPLVQLHQLERCHVWLSGDFCGVRPEDMSGLGRLRGLQALEFDCRCSRGSDGGPFRPTLQALTIDDNLFKQICVNNPELRRLTLWAESSLATKKCFEELATNCRHVEEFKLGCTLHLEDLKDFDASPMLPRLRRCELVEVVSVGPDFDVEDAIGVYEKHMPSLMHPIRDSRLLPGDQNRQRIREWFERGR